MKFTDHIIMARHATKGSKGSKGGAVVRALASHQCGRVSNPGVDAICGLSYCGFSPLLREVFYPGKPVFPSPQKPTPPNSKSIWKARTRFNECVRTPKCSVGKQISKKKKTSQKKVIIIRKRHSTLEIFKRSFTRTGAKVWNLVPFDRRNASKCVF